LLILFALRRHGSLKARVQFGYVCASKDLQSYNPERIGVSGHSVNICLSIQNKATEIGNAVTFPFQLDWSPSSFVDNGTNPNNGALSSTVRKFSSLNLNPSIS
jgi:hypothetical protein